MGRMEELADKACRPSPLAVSADTLFRGRVVVAVPHSDDEILGCGEALAQITDKQRVRFVYASDGALSPAPFPDLVARRREEAVQAVGSLGYPPDSLVFLDIPDGALARHQARIDAALRDLCAAFQAETLLAPFRLDWHPDHLAVHRAAAAVAASGPRSPRLYEYFVYFRYRMLPRGDLRSYVRPEHLLTVHAPASAAGKRAAIEHYVTQRQRVLPWQARPVLDGALLDRLVEAPECYLDSRAARGRPVLTVPEAAVRAVQVLEPALKAVKDRFVHRRSRPA